ncbi:unnamed protein product [Vitrella brassicaformis CCMP3155]|uniref:Uncharacterized protein n=1 Tax=Vitrella brassicaformis (strain CCMP3155) TaxID=1169540 RepID=A0A0G4EUB9_VITBC|nr:unnamed protein product [Vitrella brassicaformis CCMP3155]|eukprot:CEM02249.1 unnamed protein product [Vitrella brassicaformis CCMP3155]
MFPVPPPPPPSVGSFQCKTASLPHQRPYVGPPGPLPQFGRPPMPVTPPNGRFVQTVLQRGPGPARQSPLPPPPSMLGFTPPAPLSGCPSARQASNRTAAVPFVPPKFIAQPVVKERVIEIEKHEIEEQVVELPQTVYKEKFVEVPKKVIQHRIVYVRKPRVTRDPYRPVQAHRMASVQPPMNMNVAQLQRPRPYVGPPGPLPQFGRPPMPVTPPNGRFVQTVLQRGPGPARQSPLPPPPSMLGFTPPAPLSGCPSARQASNRTAAVPFVPPKFIAQPVVKERVIEIEKHEIEEQVVELPQTVYKEKFVEVPKKVIQDRIVYVRKPRVTRDPYRPVQAHRTASVQPPMNMNVAQLQRPDVHGAALVSPRLPHVRPPILEHMMSNPFAAPPPAHGPSRRLEHLWSHPPPHPVARDTGRAPGVGDVGGMASPPMGAPRVVQYGQTGAVRQGAGGTCLTSGSGMASPMMAPRMSNQYPQAGAGREASHGTSLTRTRDGPRLVRVDLSSPSRRGCPPCSPPVCPPLLRSPPPARAGGPLNQRRGNTPGNGSRRKPPLPPYMRRRS